MKKLRLIPIADQEEKWPQPGQDVYVAIDLSRRKWVYGVRWGGEFRRRWSSPAGLEHVQAMVKHYHGCRLHVVYCQGSPKLTALSSAKLTAHLT
jgi:predicted RNA-binding protein (virulence factor B family)